MAARFGPYRVQELLGRGGMGIVYRAVHQESGQEVALKTVQAANPEALTWIRHEIHALSRLSHPGIVSVLDHGHTPQGLAWYAMDLIDGDELTELRGCPRPRALSLVRQICAALAYMHGAGVVHQDLKLSNVILRRADGWPVIVDFGLAMHVSGGERSRDLLELGMPRMGSLLSMSPEQLRGEPVDARADIYALGCLMFELLTGELPFTGATTADVMTAHLEAPPPRLSRWLEEVPEELEQLLARMFAKSVHDRIGHADTVAATLEAMGAQPLDRPAPTLRPCLFYARMVGRDAVLDGLSRYLQAILQGDVEGSGVVCVK
ncbi:MAG: serine/threonine-protein kinase, partial [Myxococcota bacterium]